mmetsp:Transcript_3464/g.7689  ORF Transcript_3464/g.7689 Transcript_3464/m.7689 type:complete len:190 (+) Transcript_3464:145-714(+)|eukprot:CAMPEP_0171328828 /NCGR_PEP_ID=MMETSP0878-20121228/873_1 /TAXON_ID=67004 /ORGANISM="Thalassiosira weissflogii, Strain CCMP1336" /LENGTH=189 /DNA_ID=CAMNT_0011828707 /DNA_START=96 /DNA_END=665 /DNA_ORIENTATION=-
MRHQPLLNYAIIAASTSAATAFMAPASSSSLTTRVGDVDDKICRNFRTTLLMAGDETTEKAAPMVTGAELEAMLQEWDTPLVVDAYATWCGPCLLMAPEFESAAQQLRGKVRFVKMDTDLEPQMAGRLGIMGLPTLLFLDKNDDTEAVEEGKAPVAVLKERIEGALRKDSIVALCDYHFFGGPMPEKLF